MKLIWLICMEEKTGQFLAHQLLDVMGDAVEIRLLALEREPLPKAISADLVLLTARRMASEINRVVDPHTPVLQAARTVLREDWQSLMALPARMRVLVVHENEASAHLLVTMLSQLGANHLHLVPWAPDQEGQPDVDLALTFGQVHLVPPWISRVLDMGTRPMDPVTILDVMTTLGLHSEQSSLRLQGWMGKTIPRNHGLVAAFSWVSDLKQHFETVLDFCSDAIVATDADGRITIFNRRAEDLFNLRAAWAVGRPAGEIMPGESLARLLDGHSIPPDQPVRIAGADVTMTCLPIRQHGRITGAAALFRLESEAGPGIARALGARQRGQSARYTFSDFVGQAPELQKLLARARQIARSASTVLILGETGTGKEMMAQAIHNASDRQKGPFVAVNCAALPDSLVESELFGYEEGAFTGAVRGGRQGLFEQAHGGTIFLDEIGDISPSVQARLLRVLEERQVLRVGGNRLIPLDVRVIAATNQDLADLVAQGRFRADLYYRLNVLTLQIPPLRQRPADIPLVVMHFLAQRRYRYALSPSVMAALTRYTWPGNLRELRNCIEHMTTVSVGPIGLEDLPATVLAAGKGLPSPFAERESAGSIAPLLDPDQERLVILRTLAESVEAGVRLGRGGLRDRLAEAGLRLTEAEVRARLARLAAEGLVVAGKGRQGSRPSPAGWALLR